VVRYVLSNGGSKEQNQRKVVNGDHPLADTTYNENEKYSDYSKDAILSEQKNQPIHDHAELMFKFLVSSLPVGYKSVNYPCKANLS